MSDTPLELDWEAATPSAPVYAPGEVVTHPMFGEVVILAVDASGAFPVYTCRGVSGASLEFKTSAVYLS